MAGFKQGRVKARNLKRSERRKKPPIALAHPSKTRKPTMLQVCARGKLPLHSAMTVSGGDVRLLVGLKFRTGNHPYVYWTVTETG